ncbi:hypothetical protein TGDOM2_242890A [Toxoplasma gondii GAB2-2007-GAL-DOM2]|uniref:Proteasome activator Blm10 middle HEAT repeats region domain-containing protein n=1 Tax=Toxoplasma gondii GAB2-2007-GAL-DOM2 TaxID=1130820 RepID=A0A086JL97_TOXGO|nr:hypothetical protein TGDOM2_242890A [Toxoplasma gondii GAB2-2007-GAL-DOM2]
MKPTASSRYAQSVAPASAAASPWRQGLRLSRRGGGTPYALPRESPAVPDSGGGEGAEEADSTMRDLDEREGNEFRQEKEGSCVGKEREEDVSSSRAEECLETQARMEERTPLETLKKHLKWRWMLLHLLRRFDRSYRGQVGTSTARRKALVTALVRLASACRPFWGFSPAFYSSSEPNGSLADPDSYRLPSPLASPSSFSFASRASSSSALQFLKTVAECREEADLASLVMHGVRHGTLFEALDLLVRTTNLTSARLFLRFRLLLLFAPPPFCFSLVRDGRLMRLWGWVDGAFAPSWDALFVVLLFRACKFGWATGRPLSCSLRRLLPFLFQILLRVFQLPHSAPAAAATLKRQRETIPGEFTPLLENQFQTPSQMAKVLALLLEPLPAGEEAGEVCGRGQERKKVERPLFSAGGEETHSEEKSLEEGEGMTAFKLLESLLSTLLIYTHPSSDGGRGAAAIGAFLNAFISAYIRRIQRERLGENVVRRACGRHLSGCCLGRCSAGRRDPERKEADEASERGGEEDARETGKGGKSCECCWCREGATPGKEFLCRRLGRREDEKVVQLLAPIFLQGMFSKHMAVASCYEDGMKLLCHLQPETVVEGVLERAAASLETVTEANHTNTVQLLSRSAQTLVKVGTGEAALRESEELEIRFKQLEAFQAESSFCETQRKREIESW